MNINDIIRLLETADIYDAANAISKLVGKDKFIAAANGDVESLYDIGNMLIKHANSIKHGPVKIKDSKFLDSLKKLKNE